MTSETRTPASHRGLLGFHLPSDAATPYATAADSQPAPELGLVRSAPRAAPFPQSLPPQPGYGAGDASDEEQTSKGSDLMAAIRAGVMLIVLMVALVMLISG